MKTAPRKDESTAELVSLPPPEPMPVPPPIPESARGDGPGAGPRVGSLLAERYRLDELVGEGAMGRVYRAEHVLMKKRVAVKVLHAELTRVPEMVARFEREAMAAANLDHPNAAAAIDFGRTPDGSIFLVMEHVEGTILSQTIDRGRVPPTRAVHIVRQVLLALERAHGRGIVHRDVKPGNVMLVPRGDDPDFVKLLDFGIARFSPSEHPGKELTQRGTAFGTPEYMAPEQVRGEPVDARADLYSVGVLLYELLTGEVPFADESAVKVMSAHLKEAPTPPSELDPPVALDPRLESILLTLLEKDPDARFGGARAVVNALDALAPAPRAWRKRAAAIVPGARRLGARIATGARDGREAGVRWWRKSSVRARAAVSGGLAVAVIGVVLLATAGNGDARSSSRLTPSRVDAVPADTEGLAPPASLSVAEHRRAEPAPTGRRADAEVQLTIALALAEAGRIAPAITRVEGALALDPSIAEDERVPATLVLALGDRRSAETAARLLRDTFGARAVPHLVEASHSPRFLLRKNALDLLEEIAPPS